MSKMHHKTHKHPLDTPVKLKLRHPESLLGLVVGLTIVIIIVACFIGIMVTTVWSFWSNYHYGIKYGGLKLSEDDEEEDDMGNSKSSNYATFGSFGTTPVLNLNF